jgi:predicted NUDIX family NTP pyrophosphohydrolase
MAATNPILHQAGVIAYRILDGKVQVLLMTSRDTGRWIIPKGNINYSQGQHQRSLDALRGC